MTKKIVKHSVLKALGALCVDKPFRDAYFDKRSIDTVRNKTNPKVDITDADYTDFSAMFPDSTTGPQAHDFNNIRVCPQRPCLLAAPDSELALGTALVDDTFRDVLFTDFDRALKFQGISMHPDEHDLLLYRIHLPETRDAMNSIAEKIKEAADPTVFVLEEAA